MNNAARVIAGIGIGFGFGIAFQFGAGAAGYQVRSATGPNQAALASTGQPAVNQTTSPAPGRGLGGFTEPAPLDFNDHDGYVSLFDGVSLKGWDGNPKFWRVENGAIVGESTPDQPERQQLHRVSRSRGEGLHAEVRDQGRRRRRQRDSVPQQDRAAVAGEHLAGASPPTSARSISNWMMTGPQADFWPSRVYTGQFYSENTPMRILAWRGQVVEGFGARARS